MNASAKHITRLVALTMLMPCLAWSAGFDILPPIDDPLGTRSAMPKNAVMLPGDTMQAPCGGGAHTVGATLGVVEVVDLTMCNNPRLRDAWAVVKQQASALGEARSAYLPTLSLNLNRLRTETQYEGGHTGVTGNTLYGSMNWQILDFGTRAASVRAAVYLLESALANNDATLQKSLADTIQAYFDVQSTRAAWQAKQLSVATAAATLASTERRESNGTLARSDRLQAATALARAELDQNRAQGNYVKATALLVYAMGLPPSADVTFKEEHEDQEESSASVQLDRLDQWLRAAEQSHPAIRAARAEWASAQSRSAAVRTENMPTVGVTASAYRNGYPGQGISTVSSRVRTIGVAINIPLFDGFAHSYKVRGAEAQSEQKEHALADTEHRVLADIVKVHAEAMAAVQNLDASEKLVNAAEESMHSYERRYARGASDIVELLAAQNALADAREQRIVCVSEWRSARLRLMAASGVLGRRPISEAASQATTAYR